MRGDFKDAVTATISASWEILFELQVLTVLFQRSRFPLAGVAQALQYLHQVPVFLTDNLLTWGWIHSISSGTIGKIIFSNDNFDSAIIKEPN